MLDFETAIQAFANPNSTDEERFEAAELMMYCDEESTKEALFKVLSDTTEKQIFRDEAALVLGYLWAEGNVDYDMLLKVPEEMLKTTLSYLEMRNAKLQKNLLEDRAEVIKKIYEGRIL